MEVIQTRENNTVKAGITQSHKMTIDEGASIFYLLSEALYSNPVTSSVREIITNAYDAHIINGSKDPIKVTTDRNTGLVTVQDSGGGIPHDEFNKVYGSLGYSTKVGSKEQTGGMGIGKLSPLAVNDSFFVYNTFNGTTKLHVISRGTNETKGAHTIDTSDVEHSGLKDGLKVVFGTNSTYLGIGSVNSYINKLSYIGLIPIELNQELLYKPDDSFNPDAKGFFVDVPIGTHVKYGNNFYTVPSLWVRESRLYQHYFFDERTSIVLCAEPDTLQITPSREELLVTDSNRDTILKLLRNFLNELNKYKKSISSNTVGYCDITVDYYKQFHFTLKERPTTKSHHVISSIETGVDRHLVLTHIRQLDLGKVLYRKFPKLGLRRCNDLLNWNGLGNSDNNRLTKHKLSRRADKVSKLFESIPLSTNTIVQVGSTWVTHRSKSPFLFLLHPSITQDLRIVITNDKSYRSGSIVLYTGSRVDPVKFSKELSKLLPNLDIKAHAVNKSRAPVKAAVGVNLFMLLTGKLETKRIFSNLVYEGAKPVLLREIERIGELPDDFIKGVTKVFDKMDKEFKNYYICEKDVSDRTTVKKMVNSFTILDKMREAMTEINEDLYVISEVVKDCVKSEKELVRNKDKMTKGKNSIIRVLARNILPEYKELTQAEVIRVYENTLLMVYLLDSNNRGSTQNSRDFSVIRQKTRSVKENIKAISYLSNTQNLDGFVNSLITEVDLQNED